MTFTYGVFTESFTFSFCCCKSFFTTKTYINEIQFFFSFCYIFCVNIVCVFLLFTRKLLKKEQISKMLLWFCVTKIRQFKQNITIVSEPNNKNQNLKNFVIIMVRFACNEFGVLIVKWWMDGGCVYKWKMATQEYIKSFLFFPFKCFPSCDFDCALILVLS